jgi:hypothetical protein
MQEPIRPISFALDISVIAKDRTSKAKEEAAKQE